MSNNSPKALVSERRKYKVLNTQQAKGIAENHLKSIGFNAIAISYGLPEIDDRYHVWRVPVLREKGRIGEVVIDAYTSNVDISKSTDRQVLETATPIHTNKKLTKKEITLSELENMVIEGNSIESLKYLPEDSVNLIFTSLLIIMLNLNILNIQPMKNI